MRWALFLLTLTGQCLDSTCHLYSYTFINVNMTWNESQMYCRTHHTDLAILFNGKDEKRLRQSAKTLNGAEGWIGLYHLQPAPRQWHWSLPEETFSDTDTRWMSNQPDDGGQQENCVAINPQGKWADTKCNNDEQHGFICCDGNQQCEIVKNGNNEVKKKNWRDAQIDCRGQNKDLISGIKQLEEFNLTHSDSEQWLWIGLFRDQWQWSNGISSNFRNWESDQDNTEGEKCAWIELRGSKKKWKSADCTERKTFFCYDGQCLVSTCHLYSYTFINMEKSWNESQMYCRTNHTDLAILFNGTDEERLRQSATTLNEAEGWIGLYHLQPAPRQWHWSLPEETFSDTDTRWRSNQPNDGGQQENCVGVNHQKKWADMKCNKQHGFICCDGNQQCEIVKNVQGNEEVKKKKWRDAQIDCRGQNKDLISGIKQLEEFTLTLSDPQQWLWIGLFRDQWQWSNGISSNFRNWESDQDNTEGEKCAWIELRGSKKWKSAHCTERKTFFCYDDEMILIREKKTWEDAWDYCREKHHDLASVTDDHQQQWIAVRAKMADTDHVWLGLRYSCTLDLWFWVNGEDFSYNRLQSDSKQEAKRCYSAVAMERGGDNTWSQRNDDEKLNFICIK